MDFVSRRSIRLKTHNYSDPGPYFVTLCSFEKACRFGSIQSGNVCLSSTGRVIQEEWLRTAKVRPEVILDAFIVMPNHLHAVVILEGLSVSCSVSMTVRVRPPKSLGSLIAGFKSACTTRVNVANNTPGRPLWQKNYYEHVIRTDDELERVREYIRENPVRWRSYHRR